MVQPASGHKRVSFSTEGVVHPWSKVTGMSALQEGPAVQDQCSDITPHLARAEQYARLAPSWARAIRCGANPCVQACAAFEFLSQLSAALGPLASPAPSFPSTNTSTELFPHPQPTQGCTAWFHPFLDPRATTYLNLSFHQLMSPPCPARPCRTCRRGGSRKCSDSCGSESARGPGQTARHLQRLQQGGTCVFEQMHLRNDMPPL